MTVGTQIRARAQRRSCGVRRADFADSVGRIGAALWSRVWCSEPGVHDQFAEIFPDDAIVAVLSQVLSWIQFVELSSSNNLLIFGRCKRPEGREIYLCLTKEERGPFRELQARLPTPSSANDPRPAKLAIVLREQHPGASDIFDPRGIERQVCDGSRTRPAASRKLANPQAWPPLR